LLLPRSNVSSIFLFVCLFVSVFSFSCAGLSGGAIAGIVIGTLAALAIFGAIVAILIMKCGAGGTASGGTTYQQF
jgi:hypothetical protein